MQYGFLKKWVEENQDQNLVFRAMQKYQDQYIIKFNKQKKQLQICLANDCFCFFTEKNILLFSDRNDLNQFNQNLEKSKLKKIDIATDDRIIILHFERINIYNQQESMQLILELIPRYQNVILVQKNQIIDCLRKISFAENTHRQVLPGVTYSEPPTDFIVQEKEIKYPLQFNEKLKLEKSESAGFSDMNSAFEALYYKGILHKKIEQFKKAKIKAVKKKLKQKERKIIKLKNELKDASKEEFWKQQAELLKANFSKIKTGMKSIKLTNYYENDFPEILIKLDEKKSSSQNVEYYFKKYRKARDGKVKIAQQIDLTETEIHDLEMEIIEIEESDALPDKEREKNKKSSSKTEKYKMLKVDENWEIYIGRTSRENDFLTTRLAKSHDWWFHTRIFRGTHVILRNLNKRELPDKMKLICCRLAAYYSKAKKSGNVPVDFTQIRYVRKPKGSAIGFVTYTNHKTLYVDPLSMRDAKNLI
ncbi:MAG: NFACT RNA binding domain-containing protein [Candidatus Cloacimonetes bacterium]|nr:NFACT RNA binding domain-containing protein [Candidatus Cloacimonadota bacterium]MCF7813487.1 NFACT RNA binding domain-containing protein [Candidatus Cloacimonadota bacterium]MCF7868590.1 NFACT RNA binding domain-containing protein [Candidatus Cloacimonadota bacterium]MCF7883377.1 NFACT RNA binding domain-containing protein [Candidatus Cloacimonadota bacterium]